MKLGRLFWKFFAFIWLAQLGGIIAIGSTFWLTQRHSERLAEELDSGPGAATHVEAAASILHFAGIPGFTEWVNADRHPPVFAVDEADRDVLGRKLAPELIDHARQLRVADPRSRLVTDTIDGAGRHYLVFAAARGVKDTPPPPPNGGPGAGAGGGPPGRGLRGLPLNPMMATLLASLVTAVLLAWYVAKPIRSLRFAFDGLSAGNLAQRAAPLMGSRHDELADLGRDFDRMAVRLQSAMEGQRRLLHDVSHEVRSPLARLQAAVGLLRQENRGGNPTIERIEEEITRIDKLIGDLLKLSRLEAGELGETEATFDLKELLFEVVSDANFEWKANGRSVVWLHEAPAQMVGRPETLRGAIENVIRNAFKHAPGSQVTLETSSDAPAKRYTIRVLDAGPGVAPADLATLFTPFVRASHATHTEGYGLGLAIARRSVEAHGGTIRAVNRAAGGLMVEIILPITSNDPIPS